MLIMEPDDDPPPWTRLFVEIVVRALRGLHHDYLLYSVPQNPNEDFDPRRMNSGPGIAFADELTVCARISQEVISSRHVSGWWVPGVDRDDPENEEERVYRLKREQPYKKKKNSRKRADFWFSRVVRETGKPAPSTRPTLIEAKRAYNWPTKLVGTDRKPARSNSHRVESDIKKLRKFCGKKRRGYVLVWNVVVEGSLTSPSPQDFFETLESSNKGDIYVWQQRMIPLVAEPESQGTALPLRVSEYMWVALAEVTDIEKGDKGFVEDTS